MSPVMSPVSPSDPLVSPSEPEEEPEPEPEPDPEPEPMPKQSLSLPPQWTSPIRS